MSDSNKSMHGHLVVGTAGHIDHGKTSLVGALTGVDTDRLKEEKARGISIDLGFAHMTLSDGRALSFVDVPGHENFIKNMLAGASGIAAVMLAVAADDGVMPQTREHFEICRLLGVRTGLVAVTKIDLAGPDELANTVEAVRGLCRGSFLDGSAMIPVSARTGEGVERLREALAALPVTEANEAGALARLPVDRSFALKGFGTVVTGTLAAGRLGTGESVVVHPGGRTARIRGLRAAGKPVEWAEGGARVAVNLTGLEHTEITRGMVVTHPGPLAPTTVADVAAEWLTESGAWRKREQFLLHAGTQEAVVSLKVLDEERRFARVWLNRPALLLPGDRFVLRQPSPARTVGGGVVLDPFPPARLNRRKLEARAKRLAAATWPERLELFVEEAPAGRRLTELTRRSGRSAQQLERDLANSPNVIWAQESGRVFGRKWVEARRAEIATFLEEFHRRYPELPGAPLAQARLDLDAAVAPVIFGGFDGVAVRGETVALRTYQPKVSAEGTRVAMELEQRFRSAGYQPPLIKEVLPSLGLDPAKARAALESLIKTSRLVRVKEDMVFHADVLQHIRQSLAAHKGRRFSVPEFKEWTQVSRKHAIPLLEYLDRQRVTRRDGDFRVVL